MKVPKPDPKRSALMARVRQRGTAPETVVASLLRNLGLAYRCNARVLAGSPDFSNQRKKWAIYVHGCFWHHHTGCKHATVPKANEAFWRNKFATNRRRDARALRILRREGFRVVVVWECETREIEPLTERLADVVGNSIRSRSLTTGIPLGGTSM
jgi:DNA mismatch endonuclease (patch repair protein)